jgi:hypothetical protein
MIMKFFKVSALVISATIMFSACNAGNINSDSVIESTTNNSQISLADSEITSSIDKDDLAIGNEAETITNAEESAESFVKSYYECIYLCSSFDTAAHTAYKSLAEYLNQKTEYKQEIINHSAIEAMTINAELKEKDESDDKAYMVYYVEAFFDEKGLDYQTGFGTTIQIIIDKNNLMICDFYDGNDSIDIKLRENDSVNMEKIVWEDDEASEVLLSKLKDIFFD